MILHGLLLAAGAGSRMGTPKALVSDADGHWLPRGVAALADGGCGAVTVVLGAAADTARPLVPPEAQVVLADDWATGMSASLRAGLAALDPTDADAAVVHLVDLPDVGPAVVRRLVAAVAGPAGSAAVRGALARAAYAGIPGHPVLLGRRHWPGIVATLRGDQGARTYLAAHHAEPVECGDLASGRDVDSRE